MSGFWARAARRSKLRLYGEVRFSVRGAINETDDYANDHPFREVRDPLLNRQLNANLEVAAESYPN
jgi:hypothetical protein